MNEQFANPTPVEFSGGICVLLGQSSVFVVDHLVLSFTPRFCEFRPCCLFFKFTCSGKPPD